MSNEWIDQLTMQDVAKSQAQGWEIEHRENSGSWFKWLGFSWQSNWEFRAREPMPAMKKVKLLGYLTEYRMLAQIEEGFAAPAYWKRFPAGDIEAEVEA